MTGPPRFQKGGKSLSYAGQARLTRILRTHNQAKASELVGASYTTLLKLADGGHGMPDTVARFEARLEALVEPLPLAKA
jgi:hypothetical protein